MARDRRSPAETVVFLGPSLPVDQARELLEADFRPPVRRGDLVGLSDVDTVVIIDGEFWQSLSVSPKEILALIDRGVRVLGASSMGALRAAELAPFGMEGCGRIFERYSSGEVVGDDEVALMYSPLTWQPLTVPLINVRFWLEQLRERGYLTRARATVLLRRARGIFFAERTNERLYDTLRHTEGATRLRAWLRATGGGIPDVKAEDARVALRRAAGPIERRPGKRREV